MMSDLYPEFNVAPVALATWEGQRMSSPWALWKSLSHRKKKNGEKSKADRPWEGIVSVAGL